MQDVSRIKCSARNFFVMALKDLTVNRDVKDLHAHPGSIHTCCIDRVKSGMSEVIRSLFGHNLSRVKWGRSEKDMMILVKLTKEFIGLDGHVIGMTYGLKL